MTTLPHLRDREKEGRERRFKDALYIILCLIILLIEMKIEGCKLHKDVTHGTLFAYRAFKVFFMLGIQ